MGCDWVREARAGAALESSDWLGGGRVGPWCPGGPGGGWRSLEALGAEAPCWGEAVPALPHRLTCLRPPGSRQPPGAAAHLLQPWELPRGWMGSSVLPPHGGGSQGRGEAGGHEAGGRRRGAGSPASLAPPHPLHGGQDLRLTPTAAPWPHLHLPLPKPGHRSPLQGLPPSQAVRPSRSFRPYSEAGRCGSTMGAFRGLGPRWGAGGLEPWLE